MANFQNIVNELKASIQYEIDNLNEEKKPYYLPSVKNIVDKDGKPTKKALAYNRKLLREGKLFNYLDDTKMYNPTTGKFSNKLTVKTKQIKKKFTDKKNNIGDTTNIKGLFTPTENSYKKELFKQLKQNNNQQDKKETQIKIDLTKIGFKDIVDLIKNTGINKDYFVLGKTDGNPNLISFSNQNIEKLKNFQNLLSSDYSVRFGSDTEFVMNALKKRFFTLLIKPRVIEEQEQGAFFQYYHLLKDIDLTKYGIYSEKPKNYNNNCLYNALKEGGLSNKILNDLYSFVKCGSVPICKLNEICKKLGICIKLNRIKTYNLCGDKKTDTCYYGDKTHNIFNIGLIDNHYFINDRTNITCYAVNNYDDVKDIKDYNKICRKKGKYYDKSNNYYIDSFNLVKLLIKNKENVLIKIPTADLFSTQFYDLKNENEDLNYGEACCEKNEVREFNVKYAYDKVFYFDFETDTSGKKHKPYLMSFYEDDIEKKLNGKLTPCNRGEPITFVGEDCGKDFVEYIRRKIKKQDKESNETADLKILLIAHNCRYDFTFIMDYLNCLKPILKGNSLMGGSARIYSSRYNFAEVSFFDSRNFLAMKLSSFKDVFNLNVKKEILPYDLYTTQNIKDVLISKEECLKYVKTEEHEEYLENCKMWGCDYDDEIDIIAYSIKYCEMDCEVLKKGISTFREWMCDITGLDIYYYCSIASVSLDYIVKEGCFNDCYKLAGTPRDFIQKCVVGGRVMCRDNKKWKVEGKINDFDAVSLYPSAMKRMKGFLKGKPLVIKDNQKTFDFLNKTDGYFIKVRCKNNPLINRHFPLLSNNEEDGIRNFSNETIGKIYYIDKTTYEDCVNFQGLEFDIICGYYYSFGHNNKINNVIEYLFSKRIEAKKNKNPIQAVYKLLMNSCYGKALLKPIDSDSKIVDAKVFNKYMSKKYNFVKEIIELKEKYIVKEIKVINEHYNNVYAGVEILSMSKRIMNEVICLAEDKNLKIYYQDTDSIHINDKDIEILQNSYNKKYGRELIGKNMGQFHSDFELDGCKNIYSEKAIFLGKKCYLDCLVGEDIKTGEIIKGHHIRMKGISKVAIEYCGEQNDITIDNIYENLFKGDIIEFDLLAGGKSCKFQYGKDMSVSSVSDFSRKVKFSYEEGIMV